MQKFLYKFDVEMWSNVNECKQLELHVIQYIANVRSYIGDFRKINFTHTSYSKF